MSFPFPSNPLLTGAAPDVMNSNVKNLKSTGLNEYEATRQAIKAARPRHQNLGKFLHPRKDGKPHGSDCK
jgi:hypothetical protein